MSHRITIWLTCLLLIVGPLAPVALATDYFVTNNGAPTGGDGSAGTPFGTITEALTSGSLVAGDRLHIDSGVYDAAGGEVFPLVLPVPMEMIGTGGTVVAFSSFEAIDIDNSSGASGEYAFRNMTFDGLGSNFNEAISMRSSGGSADLIVESCTFFECNAMRVDWRSGGVHSLSVLNCNMTSAGGDIIELTGSGYPGTAYMEMNVVIESNNFYGNMDGTMLEATVYTMEVANLSIKNNNCYSVQQAISLYMSNDGVPANIFADIASNCFTGLQYTGIRVVAQGESELANYDVNIVRNELQGSDRGIELSITAYDGISSVTATNVNANFVVASNAVRSCSIGIELTAYAGNMGIMRGCISVNNNLFENCDSGIELDAYEASNALVLLDFNLGGQGVCAPAGAVGGLNTFDGISSQAVIADVDPHIDVSAVANFWGTRNLGLIENMVFHSVDDPFYGTVDYAKPLPNGINLRATPRKVFQAGGQTVTVRAKNTGFVQQCGCDEISVTLDGIPMLNVQVAANGRSLTFEVPPMPSTGAAALEITNPGGQTGAYLMGVKP